MLWKRVSTSRKVNRLSLKAALLWTWCQPHLDVEGYIEAEADYLKYNVVPMRKDIKENDIPVLVQEIIDIGLWEAFKCNGVMVVREIKFNEMQSIKKNDEAPSLYTDKITPVEPQGNLGGSTVEPLANINKVNINKVKEGDKESGPSQDPLKITFDWDKKKFINITDEDKLRWRDAYPSVNIDIEIRKAVEWVLSNPEKRKQKWRSFLTRWFSRTQERGGTKDGASSDKKTFDPVDRAINEAEERLRRDQH
jgi:hypothetical protein